MTYREGYARQGGVAAPIKRGGGVTGQKRIRNIQQ